MTISSSNNSKRTVRELGGEFYSEIFHRIPENAVNWKEKELLVDIFMGVMARHAGKVIENDKDLPVEPLDSIEPV
ncbi:MAG: hypothetical protein AAGN46_12740 [Acidobacteriota bacterium]